jgi:hypothetical protein
MLKRFAAVILFLLPLELYAQAGPGPVPYRGVSNFDILFPNAHNIGQPAANRPANGYFGTSIETPALTVSGLTATRVLFAGTGGLVQGDADCTFATDTLSCTKFAASAGSSSATSIRMTDDNTGFAEVTSTNWGWYVNGTESVRLGSAGQVSSLGGIALGPSIAAPDAIVTRSAAGVARLAASGGSVRGFWGGGAAASSATALAVPAAAVYHVTGTTTITSITSTNVGTGVCVTLIFDGVLTFTDGSNLKLAGDFVTTADDTIGLCYDGTNWYETHRSVN